MNTSADRWARLGLRVDVADLAGRDIAAFSPEPPHSYRYILTRGCGNAGKTAVWVMLNPSTAGAVQADATLRRCLGFARTWGCAGVTILNLFGLRATDPKELLAHPDPVGKHNDAVIQAVAHDEHYAGALWIAAWGALGGHRGRDTAVAELLIAAGRALHTVNLTKDGQPGHPLRVQRNAPLVSWRPRGRA